MGMIHKKISKSRSSIKEGVDKNKMLDKIRKMKDRMNKNIQMKKYLRNKEILKEDHYIKDISNKEEGKNINSSSRRINDNSKILSGIKMGIYKKNKMDLKIRVTDK